MSRNLRGMQGCSRGALHDLRQGQMHQDCQRFRGSRMRAADTQVPEVRWHRRDAATGHDRISSNAIDQNQSTPIGLLTSQASDRWRSNGKRAARAARGRTSCSRE